MNSNKKSIMRPVAPPVYRPKTTANAAQPKMANGVVNRTLPVAPPVFRPQVPKVLQTKSSQNRQPAQVSHQHVARPVYRPEAKTIVQPKTIAANVRPITAKRTACSFNAVQMADDQRKAHECSAKVVANSGVEYPGEYDGSHAEINALEKYFEAGGDVAGITRIDLSSSPCKYCHIILTDLGIRQKVVCGDQRKYGRCQGGSYGWFARGGSLWKAIKKATGANDEDEYSKSVSERAGKL